MTMLFEQLPHGRMKCLRAAVLSGGGVERSDDEGQRTSTSRHLMCVATAYDRVSGPATCSAPARRPRAGSPGHRAPSILRVRELPIASAAKPGRAAAGGQVPDSMRMEMPPIVGRAMPSNSSSGRRPHRQVRGTGVGPKG